jgi:hypothetical protein
MAAQSLCFVDVIHNPFRVQGGGQDAIKRTNVARVQNQFVLVF